MGGNTLDMSFVTTVVWLSSNPKNHYISDVFLAPEEDTERQCQLLNDHPGLVTKELDLVSCH